jgi:hypothetical protein
MNVYYDVSRVCKLCWGLRVLYRSSFLSLQLLPLILREKKFNVACQLGGGKQKLGGRPVGWPGH